MKITDPRTKTIWFDTDEFAKEQMKSQRTIRLWCRNGFIIELGYLLVQDPTGHYRIGIPSHHNSYPMFAA